MPVIIYFPYFPLFMESFGYLFIYIPYLLPFPLAFRQNTVIVYNTHDRKAFFLGKHIILFTVRRRLRDYARTFLEANKICIVNEMGTLTPVFVEWYILLAN